MNISVNVNQFNRLFPQQVTPKMYQLHMMSTSTENSMFLNFDSPEQAIAFLDKAKQVIEKDLERGKQNELRRAN